MTSLLKEMLRDDYLNLIKVSMVEQGFNNSSLARRTEFSVPHIGNILNGGGSDEALRTVCSVLGIGIRSLLKDEYKDQNGGQPDEDTVS